MKDSLKKGLIIGAAGSAICVLWHHLLTKKMMQLAMDRVAPQDRSNGKMRVSGSPEMIETTEIVKKAAGQLEKSGCDVVEITAHDGISLIGHWCPCEEPKRTIVAMHGWRSSWSHDFGLIADFWRNNHCSVLYAEQRGQNNSGGDHMSLGLLERYDCLAWTNWINEKTGKSIPIYLAGVSMGATSVLMASELELPDNVFGIAADSAFTSLHAIWKHVSESNLHIPYALHIPELIDAVSIVISSLTNGLDQLVAFESTADYSKIPFGEQLSQIDIDFLELKDNLNEWLNQLGTTIMDTAASAFGSVVATAVDFAIGLVFSIYILANKEKLKSQITRIVRVWIPACFAERGIHVAAVCEKNFKLFVAGQTTEAIILGSLCAIGMLILRIPYAPMIGALVGVTALIPYVGAWIATLVGAFLILTVNPFKALVFIIFLLTLQQIEGNAIYPKVVGAKINLPAMWVLAAITIGGNLAGPIGMLLGVPAAAATYALLKEATDKRETHLKTQEKEQMGNSHKQNIS